MAMIDRRLLWAAIVVGSLGIAAFLIVRANVWWLSGVVTLSIGCWLAGVLYAIYLPPERRTPPLAALVCSFLYLLMAGGPWFETHVGPWLITTRALMAIDTHLLDHDRQSPTTIRVGSTTWSQASLYTSYTIPQPAAWQTVEIPIAPSVAMGQWLVAWCAAASGAFAARWLRRERPAAAAQAQPALDRESPFAETRQ